MMEQYAPSNWELLKKIWILSWPAVLEQLFQTAVQYADTAMVGQLGANASAATGLTSSVLWLIGSLISAVGVALVAKVSYAVGAKQEQEAHRYAGIALWLSLAVGLLIGGFTTAFHRAVPVWMGAEEAIRAEAGTYFLLICLPMVFRASSNLFAAVLRGVGDMRHPMQINILMNLLNVILNFFMIYPCRTLTVFGVSFACPGLGLGVFGAGLSTAISFVVGGSLMAWAVYRNPVVTFCKASSLPRRAELQPLWAIAGPVMLQRFTACMGYIVFARLVAVLGTVSLAAHSIANTAEGLFYIAGFGIQAAAATLAGNCLGANERRTFERLVKLLCIVTALIMTGTGLTLFTFPQQIMSIFTHDAAVIAAGTAVLKIVALSEPLFGLQIILEGVFNGIGDTKPPFVYALMTMWGVRICGSFLCIHFFHLGLEAVWCCMVADNVLRALLLWQRFLRKKWLVKFEH